VDHLDAVAVQAGVHVADGPDAGSPRSTSIRTRLGAQRGILSGSSVAASGGAAISTDTLTSAVDSERWKTRLSSTVLRTGWRSTETHGTAPTSS
jgi:hypothetical protein